MQISTLHVDFEGTRNLASAVQIENEHVETLREMQKAIEPGQTIQELESVDDEQIAYAIQHFEDNAVQTNSKMCVGEKSWTISVFLNKEFYKDFELHQETQVVHTAHPKEDQT